MDARGDADDEEQHRNGHLHFDKRETGAGLFEEQAHTLLVGPAIGHDRVCVGFLVEPRPNAIDPHHLQRRVGGDHGDGGDVGRKDLYVLPWDVEDLDQNRKVRAHHFIDRWGCVWVPFSGADLFESLERLALRREHVRRGLGLFLGIHESADRREDADTGDAHGDDHFCEREASAPVFGQLDRHGRL